MSVDSHLLHEAKHLVEAMDKTVDKLLPYELADIVKFHSKGAAAAALAAAWVPGAGGTAAALASAGFIWSMYGRIGSKIGLPFGTNLLKSLASGVATNLATGVAGAILFSSLISFIPGLGSVGASVIMGATCYAVTLAAGYIYLKILTKLFKAKVDLTNITEQELKDMAESAATEDDVSEVIRKAKAEFKTKKKEGEFD